MADLDDVQDGKNYYLDVPQQAHPSIFSRAATHSIGE